MMLTSDSLLFAHGQSLWVAIGESIASEGFWFLPYVEFYCLVAVPEMVGMETVGTEWDPNPTRTTNPPLRR